MVGRPRKTDLARRLDASRPAAAPEPSAQEHVIFAEGLDAFDLHNGILDRLPGLEDRRLGSAVEQLFDARLFKGEPRIACIKRAIGYLQRIVDDHGGAQ